MLCTALSRMLHDDSYLIPREVVLNRITVINFRVNDGGGSGTECCGIEVRADTAEFTNVIISGFRKR